MSDRDDLSADLWRRIGEAVEREDATGVFTADAERAADALAAVVDPAGDVEAGHVLGVYHWIRFTALPEGAGQDGELVEALRFLGPVHDAEPDAVPEPLRVVFTGRESDGVTGGTALEFGLAVCLAYERGRHLSLLRRAVELFRAAIAGPFDDPQDRAMSLNNLGYALRLTYEGSRDASVLDEAVAAAREAVTASDHPEQAMFLSNLGLALLQLHWRNQDLATLDEAVAAARRAVVLALPAHPSLMTYRYNLGVVLHVWADARISTTAAAEAIGLTRAAVDATPVGDPARGARLYLLCTALQKQYERTAEVELLVEAVAVGREVLAATPQGHRSRAERLDRFAVCLYLLFGVNGDLAALREAVTATRAAVDAAPADASDRAQYLNNLSVTLQKLAEHTRDRTAAGEAVAAARAALDAGADPDRPQRLVVLANALHTQHEHTTDVDQLTESVAHIREALALAPADHPNRPEWLSNLGLGLRVLHEAVGRDEFLDEAVAVGREAAAGLPADQPRRAVLLTNLGAALTRKYEREGRVELAAEAVDRTREAVDATPVGHPDRPKWLNNLGMALNALSLRTGERAPLDEAAAVLEESVGTIPAGHPIRGTVLSNLADVLTALFLHTADTDALRRATETARASVDATPVPHPNRANHLNSLGRTLQYLFWYTGDSAPLAESIAACRAAVAEMPDDHPHRSMYLGNLGTALQMSFRRLGRPEDLAEAVAVGREAVAALPDGHPRLALHLYDLATSLFVQAMQSEDPGSLDEALPVARRGLAAAPGDHPNRNQILTLLSGALRLQSIRDEDPAPLYEAIDTAREAVALTPPGFALHAATLNNHALSLHMLYEHTRDAGLRDEILSASRSAAEDGSAAVGIRVASYRRIAVLAGRDGTGAEEALAAAEAAVALLPQIGLGDLDLADRGQLIGDAGSLASAAAAAALDAWRPRRAVELLEQSRGVLTAESVAAGGAELDRLRSAAPELAAALEELRARRETLDRPAPPTVETPAPLEVPAAARRDAQAEWNRLLARIRALDGFSAFLTPPGAAQLTAQAAQGPVVYVSAAPTRCDALVLTGDPGDPVRVVPLDDLTEAEVLHRIVSLGTAIDATGNPAVDPVARRTAQRDILRVLAWLWDTVTEPVLTALGHTAPPASGEPRPRIWWCPVGLLAYMPLHAAGHHGDLDAESPHHAAPRTVLDRVVSSYTTTVRGLARARGHRWRTGPGTRTAVVAVPDAPGAAVLAGAAAEAELLTGLVPGAEVLPRPTRESVLAALPRHPVAHFACHSEPHRIDPWQGRLILHDHGTRPLTVADIGALRLDGGLAFLSACNTALTAPRLADEALHITGAFQLAGYPHVVGTQWPVADRAAHQLASDFYGRLTADGTAPPDPSLSAEALHHATRRLRARYPVTPTLWAAHTHTGA